MKGRQQSGFWARFAPLADQLRRQLLNGQLDSVFTRVEDLLAASGHGFAFELTTSGNSGVLVLTPEGDAALAREIDSLVDGVSIPGWYIYGRRQRKELEDALVFVKNIYGLDVGNSRFRLVQNGDKFDLIMFAQGVEGLSREECAGLAATFLDHALGEEVAMSKIGSVTIRARGASDPDGSLTGAQMVARLIK